MARLVVIAFATAPVQAGPVDPTTPTTSEPTSTVTSTTAPPETTTTTAAPPPTTRAPVTTTTAVRRSSTTTTAPPVSSTVEPTTTAPSTTASTAPQFIIPDDTIPPREEVESSSDSGLSTDVELGLVVGGLMAVGALIGFLTVLYWRHTRPQPYLAALDVLSDVSAAAATDAPTGRMQGIGPLPMTAAAPAAPATPAVPAAQVAPIGDPTAGAAAATGAIFADEPASADADAPSARIVGPLALFGDDSPAPADIAPADALAGDDAIDRTPAAEGTSADASDGDDAPAAPDAGDAGDEAPEPIRAPDALGGDDQPVQHPPLVTIEDLFGPSPEETSSPGS